MNDSRTLDLYKSGHIIRALARETRQAFTALLGLALFALISLPVLAVVWAVIVSPALLALMQMFCAVVWDK